ncbi:putative Zinc finger CCCH domain-containing protein 30 [Cocos nucifera]|nr:putative Zinc finger CCCH domain-containing protein 30 [Cocos nucifera]
MYQSKEQRTSKARSDEWKQRKETYCYEQANQMDPNKIPYQGLVHPKFQQKGHVESMSTASLNTRTESSSRSTPGNSNWKPSMTTGTAVLDGQCATQAMTIGRGEGKMELGSSAGGNYETTVEHVGMRKGLGGDLLEEPDIGWIYDLLE